jgi:hypothetical protein
VCEPKRECYGRDFNPSYRARVQVARNGSEAKGTGEVLVANSNVGILK